MSNMIKQLLTISLIICSLSANAVEIDMTRIKTNYITTYQNTELFTKWTELVEDTTLRSHKEQLNNVNTFFNQHIKKVTDMDYYHKADYWATPLQTLDAQAGDCEDFAIAKYFTLLLTGIPEEKLALMYVKYGIYQQAHMVLAYTQLDGSYLILDNIKPNITQLEERPDLQVVYMITASNIIASVELTDSTLQRMQSLHILSLKVSWNNMMFRASDEGFAVR